ncbi:MAG TPA: tRNA-dihydrouridine synthase [Patescibacteria group bacterium]|nr:tRNA-dihydrouridine synthase [Patescibacteria group bacterium]
MAIFCLAPMEGVTDTVFRQLIAGIGLPGRQAGKPDLMFTEFTNVSAIFSHDQTAINQRLKFVDAEQPLIAQLWGLEPELFELAADLMVGMGFAGVDLNFGCPDRTVLKQGACAALINDRPLTQAIIESTKKGLKGRIPLSIKIRLGLKEIATDDWVPFMLNFEPKILTIHGRTAKEMSEVPVHWDEIGKAVKIRNRLKSKTLIIGNGDIESMSQALDKVKKYGLDGMMIGRGIFKNPWLFNPKEQALPKTPEQKLKLLLEHARLYHHTWGITKSWHILKRFFKIYASGFDGASALREELMKTNGLAEVELVINQFLSR